MYVSLGISDNSYITRYTGQFMHRELYWIIHVSRGTLDNAWTTRRIRQRMCHDTYWTTQVSRGILDNVCITMYIGQYMYRQGKWMIHVSQGSMYYACSTTKRIGLCMNHGVYWTMHAVPPCVLDNACITSSLNWIWKLRIGYAHNACIKGYMVQCMYHEAYCTMQVSRGVLGIEITTTRITKRK